MGRCVFVSLGLLVMALSLRGVKGNCCPPGWHPLNALCYKVFEEQKNWADAETFCRKHKPGCHLASIHGKTESDDLAKYITAHLKTKTFVWIGMYDESKVKLLTQSLQERPWKWSDRSPPNYFTWNPGEPSNGGGNENCVHLWVHSGYKHWNDVACERIYPFLCQCRY